MKIVIAGIGSIGYHLAELLSIEGHDVILIDSSKEVLRHTSNHLDVMTILGDATSIETLQKINLRNTELFIAVTTSEQSNLLVCMLAKKFGAPKTIARILNPEYFKEKIRKNFEELGVDTLISPSLLAANEIQKMLRKASFSEVFEFEKGKIAVVGFTVDNMSPIVNKTVQEINQQHIEYTIRYVAIIRGDETLIPRGSTIVRKGDHLFVASLNTDLQLVRRLVGKYIKPIKKVMILGDSYLAFTVAELIEEEYKTKVVVCDKTVADRFASRLKKALVLQANPDDIDVLKEEGLAQMDAFIALTGNYETNIITSLMAENVGVYKTIASVDNLNYSQIQFNIGIDSIINRKRIAANNIFKFIRKGVIKDFKGLPGTEIEIIEFELNNKKITDIPIFNLKLPKECIILGVVRSGKAYIPDGDFCLRSKDKVVISALPNVVHIIEDMFR